MDAAAQRQVRDRAGHRCEYCRLPQASVPFATFHVDHIHALQHRQDDSLENLALACPDCNRHKGPNLTTIDPDSRTIIRLFNPRRDAWEEHFEYHGPFLVGLTEIGSATIRLLQINSDDRVELRRELHRNGEF
jgi:hypothetical protein